MADKYLDELVGTARQITGLNDDDIIHLLRQSDTTDRAGGSDYVIGGLDLMQWMGIKPIQTITLTSGAPGEFDFGPALTGGVIPTTLGHRRLEIVGPARSTASTDNDQCLIYLNAIESGYHAQLNIGANGLNTSPEQTYPRISDAPGDSATSKSFVQLSCTIDDYAGSDLKLVTSQFGMHRTPTNMRTGVSCVSSTITDPITRVRIRTDNHPADKLHGTLSLYLKF